MITTVLTGAPGSGKGTQAKILAQSCGMIHLDMGNFLREKRKKDEGFDRRWGSVMDGGDLLPDKETIDCFEEMFEQSRVYHYDSVVFDGFPRSEEQGVHLLDKLRRLERLSHMDPTDNRLRFVILTDVTRKMGIDRMRERALKQGRADDKSDKIISRRWEVYERFIEPSVTAFLELQNPRTRFYVNASGDEDQTWNTLSEVLGLGRAVPANCGG